MVSISTFKTFFFSKFKQPEIFNCGNFNIIKVAMAGVKLDYLSKGKTPTYLFHNLFFYQFVLLLKRAQYALKFKTSFHRQYKKMWGLLNDQKFKKIMLIDDDFRFIMDSKDGTLKSYFYKNIIDFFGREVILNVSQYHTNHSGYDIVHAEYAAILKIAPLTKQDKTLRKDLLDTFQSMEHNSSFSAYELQNIKVSIDLFFNLYRSWNFLLKAVKLEKAFVLCSYYQEGIIHALKENKIKVFELQHGLITPEKTFFILPGIIRPIAKKALFPDVLLVYGSYWKNILLKGFEFEESQLRIIGNYQFTESALDPHFKQFVSKNVPKGTEVALIGSQGSTTNKFLIPYIKWLENDIRSKGQQAIIIIKPHPSYDGPDSFSSFENSQIVKVLSVELEKLLSISTIFISVYSASFYDASRFKGITKFALNIKEFESHIKTILDSGVAQILELNENPIEKKHLHKIEDNTVFFDSFNTAALLN